MRSGKRCVAVVLVLGQVVLSLAGCVSVDTTGTRPAEGPGGGVAVRVFADDAARKAGKVGPAGILGELDRREGQGWVPVFRSLDPAWTVAGLPPGKYRLRFPARLDDAGNIVRMDEQTELVRVKEGMIVETQVILEHVDRALVVAGVVVAVVAAVVVSDYLDDHGLPDVPLPPPEVVEAAFFITMDVLAATTWSGVGDPLPPTVTSHFPATDALVAARRPRIIFALSEPLQPDEVEGQAVTVLAERGGLIAGDSSYDAENWWVVWTPREDLPAGDSIRVTLAAEALEDRAGNELEEAASFGFRTAE
jgi:hypothetical protein